MVYLLHGRQWVQIASSLLIFDSFLSLNSVDSVEGNALLANEVGGGSRDPPMQKIITESPFGAIIALSTVKSFERILIHNANLFINSPTMLGTRRVIG